MDTHDADDVFKAIQEEETGWQGSVRRSSTCEMVHSLSTIQINLGNQHTSMMSISTLLGTI